MKHLNPLGLIQEKIERRIGEIDNWLECFIDELDADVVVILNQEREILKDQLEIFPKKTALKLGLV